MFTAVNVAQNINLLRKCYNPYMHISKETQKVVLIAEYLHCDLHSV